MKKRNVSNQEAINQFIGIVNRHHADRKPAGRIIVLRRWCPNCGWGDFVFIEERDGRDRYRCQGCKSYIHGIER